MVYDFISSFKHYIIELAPALIVGFLLSGIIHEFVPDKWINKHLGGRGLKGVLWSTLIGAVIPVCCWGCLPIAVSFRKKGASLGPILALLIATPATSINALIVTARILGIKFALFTFFSVIIMGIVAGILGNMIKVESSQKQDESCSCGKDDCAGDEHKKQTALDRIKSVLHYAFIQMPKDIGRETLLGLVLASVVNSVMPLGGWIKHYLQGSFAYVFALVFGLVMYMCATMGVPLVDALIRQGMDTGAGFVLLLVGPITSYGTILVLRKEFGMKVLALYLSVICVLSVIFGYIYSHV